MLEQTHKEMQNEFEYGEVENIPFRFLGVNYKELRNGDIQLDQDHYIANLEVPDISSLNNMSKQDILPAAWQSTFRSIASKLNLISLSSRPDLVFSTVQYSTVHITRMKYK